MSFDYHGYTQFACCSLKPLIVYQLKFVVPGTLGSNYTVKIQYRHYKLQYTMQENMHTILTIFVINILN